MADPPANYFVCTLGQAASLNERNPHAYQTINDFFDERAISSDPAVGFPRPPVGQDYDDRDPEWDYDVLTFRDLHAASITHAKILFDLLDRQGAGGLKKANDAPSHTIALLCPSSPLFLVTWLSLMRLGLAVLLVAPQCQASAIAHLCRSCKVDTLLFDQSHVALISEVEKTEASDPLRCVKLPFSSPGEDILPGLCKHLGSIRGIVPMRTVSEHDIAYLHHTSGTSTGLPKPIPQTHRAGIGVLPCLNGKAEASFTTTPLYHGGVADCFRAWTSGAMIWLFPGKEVPITPNNVLESLRCAERARKQRKSPPVRYLSFVPYVLQQLASEAEGMSMLKSMDIVGVGGAALPENVGNELVSKGVNLISRFGSAECGFLMSSHRDYDKDKEWQYLRSGASDALGFEQQEDSLSELVIRPNWPHMAKRNRDDGSFATADLFVAHPTIPNAWKYHSRADSQLTLITGKKFDPAPLEDAILASPWLKDAMIVGNGRQSPGVLLFRSARPPEMTESVLLEQVWLDVEKLNTGSQNHARIPRSLLLVMPPDAPALPKSSKGTILRGQAETLYQAQIDRIYANGANGELGNDVGGEQTYIPDEEVLGHVQDAVQKVVGRDGSIPIDADLFSHSVDSLHCIQIRSILTESILPHGIVLPLNVVFDSRTIQGLATYLVDVRAGRKAAPSEDELQLMRDLVAKYGSFASLEPSTSASNGVDTQGRTVILTGATGSLGAHILSQLRSTPPITRIICLVRASSPEEASSRVDASLTKRRLAPLRPSDSSEEPLVECVPAKLGEPTLGLPPTITQRFQDRTTLVIHAAWAVNFSMRLRSFEDEHIRGVRHMLDLMLASPGEPAKLVFCSSVASVLGKRSSGDAVGEAVIPEAISTLPEDASELGYARSKWVAEALCSEAHTQTKLKGKIDVVRIGQLCGDTANGVWNASEAWPTMLSSVAATGCLPALDDETLGWLAVDLAAKAVVQIGLGQGGAAHVDGAGDCAVHHVLNPDRSVTWADMLGWIKDVKAEPFQVVAVKEWIVKLEGLDGEDGGYPAKKLLGLWRNAYGVGDGKDVGDDRPETKSNDSNPQPISSRCSMQRTKEAAPAMRDVGPIAKEHFAKIWRWIESEMIGGRG